MTLAEGSKNPNLLYDSNDDISGIDGHLTRQQSALMRQLERVNIKKE